MDESGTMATVVRVFNVVGFAGSLRRSSYHRALLRTATELAPPALQIVIDELDGIPLYNGEVEAAGAPSSVVQLRAAIQNANGLLIATPEYNHGVPGVLKNTIEWLSRPPRDSALNGKVAAVMGASPGVTGTARGQSQLRQTFVFTNTYALLQPEILVGRAHEKFDADGRLRAPGDARFPYDLSRALCRADRTFHVIACARRGISPV
jgi:chromate reductase